MPTTVTASPGVWKREMVRLHQMTAPSFRKKRFSTVTLSREPLRSSSIAARVIGASSAGESVDALRPSSSAALQPRSRANAGFMW